MNREELGKLLDLLREKGVSRYKADGLVIEFAPDIAPQPTKEQEADAVKQAFKQAVKPKFGPDGLTKEQQEELYGTTLDSFEGD